MHTEELIIHGTPAQFETLARSIDDLLALRHEVKDLPGAYVFRAGPHGGPWSVLTPSDALRTVVDIVSPSRWEKQGEKALNAGIEATSLPNNKTRLVMWCEETGWPEIEPFWNELKDELQRLKVLFDEDKIEAETMTITGYKIHELTLNLTCDVATFLGAVEAYNARLALWALSGNVFYEVTKKSEQSAVILVWPETANSPRERATQDANRKTGTMTVQPGPAGGCKAVLSYTDLAWPAIEKRWTMLVTMLEDYGYIGATPTAAEPQTAKPLPERPQVTRGRKPELNPDEARIACRLYEGLHRQKKVTQQDIADALNLGLGTFQDYWQRYKDGTL